MTRITELSKQFPSVYQVVTKLSFQPPPPPMLFPGTIPSKPCSFFLWNIAEINVEYSHMIIYDSWPFSGGGPRKCRACPNGRRSISEEAEFLNHIKIG